MTREQQRKKIDQMADLMKRAIEERCTCGEDPEGPCKYCAIMSKVDRLDEEIFGDA
jgi:uncharacterized Zn finger protein